MRRFMVIAASAALLASPARAERLTHEQLHGYFTLAPAAPAGWKRADRGAPFSSALTSNLGVTYTSEDGTKRFGFVSTFSEPFSPGSKPETPLFSTRFRPWRWR